MPDPLPLSSHIILVTRPAHQAHQLCTGIELAGGSVIRCPSIEILPPRDTEKALEQLKNLNDYDLAVFVSVNAVESALALLAPTKLPNKLQLAAVGISTAKCLETHGYENIIRPEKQFDSEGLLATESLQDLSNKRVAVIRGESGREWLATQLVAAGATVERIATYRRRKPAGSRKILGRALQNNQLSMISASSNEGLDNIAHMAGDNLHKLLALPLTVLSQRNREHAIKLGFKSEITIAKHASDNAIIDALIKLANLIADR